MWVLGAATAVGWWCWLAGVCVDQLSMCIAAQASSPAPLSHPSQAFLAGVAVGLTLPTEGRQQGGRQRALTVLLCCLALVVLVGCALLLGGFAQAHPQTVYYM